MLIEINAMTGPQAQPYLIKKGPNMTTNEITFLVLTLCSFSSFGGVLGWASWMDSRKVQRSGK